jgi:A/G-specific adenine glycosylase
VKREERNAQAPLLPADTRRLQRAVQEWYRNHGRTLPWRGIKDPYRILLSEIMLQQTQVSRVLVKYPLFLKRFPTLSALARAKRSDVIRAWQGMGYNNRAVRLHAMARTVVRDHHARLPGTEAGLLALPGIGTYTARAVLCSAFGAPISFVDVNILRLLSRILWNMPHTAAMKPERTIVDAAEHLLPRRRAYDWNQALMDLGATICTARSPQCDACPLSRLCASAHVMSAPPRSRSKQEPSLRGVPRRITRGRIIEQLRKSGHRAGLTVNEIGPRVLPRFSVQDRVWIEQLLAGLERDGLVRITDDGGNRVVRLA